MTTPPDADHLYRLVQEYAAIGHHRTGTVEDDLTLMVIRRT